MRAVTLLPGGDGAARKRLPSVRHRATAPGRGGRPEDRAVRVGPRAATAGGRRREAGALCLLPIAPSAGAAPSAHLPLPQIVREAVSRAQHEHPGRGAMGPGPSWPGPRPVPRTCGPGWSVSGPRMRRSPFAYTYTANGQDRSTQSWKPPVGIGAVCALGLTEGQAHDLALGRRHTGAFKALYGQRARRAAGAPTFRVPRENETVAVDTVPRAVTTPLGCRCPCASRPRSAGRRVQSRVIGSGRRFVSGLRGRPGGHSRW